MIRKLNPDKLAKLHDTSAILDRKYGERGTAARSAFEEKAYISYYTGILRDKHKELKINQQLVNKTGKEYSYTVHVGRRKIDMQIPVFFKF